MERKVLAKLGLLEEDFQISVAWKEADGTMSHRSYNHQSPPPAIFPCVTPECTGTGIYLLNEINKALRQADRQGRIQYETFLECMGTLMEHENPLRPCAKIYYIRISGMLKTNGVSHPAMHSRSKNS